MDINYLIEILVKLRDEASPQLAKLKGEIDSLKGTQDADRAMQDLDNSIKDAGADAERAEKQHAGHRKELERNKSASVDAGRGIRSLGEDLEGSRKKTDAYGESLVFATDAVRSHKENLEKARKAREEESSGIGDLNNKLKSLIARRDELNKRQISTSDVKGLNEQREAYADLDRQMKSTASSFSRFALARKASEEGIKADALRKSEQGFLEAAQARAQSERLQKLVPASRQPLSAQIADTVRQQRADEAAANAKKDLELKVSKLDTAYSEYENRRRSGLLTTKQVRVEEKGFSSEFGSVANALRKSGQEWENYSKKAEEAGNRAKNASREASGDVLGGKADNAFKKLDEHVGNLGLRITGVSSFLRGLFDLAKIGFAQQLITGIVSLVGSLVSLASAAAQAGAALAGVFISGMGQAIPMLSVIIAAALRFKNILQAVSVAGQAEQQHFYAPQEKQILQLQQTSQLISSQQQLSNSYIQLYEAQQRVKNSQIALTEARYTASRQTEELTLAEKNAKLAAEGANLGLIESKRQLEIATQKGNAAGLQQAELAVKQAELQKKSAEFAIPKAEREERLARERKIEGEPAVISARQGLEGAKLAVVQTRQAAEAAERQMRITELQQKQRSSKETSYEAQLKFLEKGMSPTELGLTNALVAIEHELKSANSPLKKITDYFVEPFTNAVERIRSLLKTSSFLGPIDELAAAMGKGLGRLEKTVYGKEGTSFFETMSKDAARNIPVVTGAIEGMMKLFEKVAKAAGPAFHKLSEDWDNLWHKLNTKYEGKGLTSLEEFFNRSVVFAEKFAHMGVALFNLFKAIGHDAAPQGLLQVTSFTSAVESATKWVQSHGPEVTKFFREAREGLSLIGQLLFGIGKSLIEVFSLSSIKAFNSFIQQILLPALRDVVNVFGFLTKWLLRIASAIPGGKSTLEGIAALLLSIAALSKIYAPIIKLISLYKELRLIIIATSIVMGETGAIGALSSIGTTVGSVIAQYKLLKATAIDTSATIVTTSAADDAALGGVVAGEAAAAGGVILPAGVTAGAAGGGLLARLGLGGAGSAALKTAGVTLGGIALTGQLTKGLGQTESQGLPTMGGFLDRTGRSFHRELESLNPFSGRFLSGSGASENSSMESLRKFGTEVEKFRNKISSLPESKLKNIEQEAINLAQNPSLKKFKGALETTAQSFNPSEIAAKKWSESIREYFEKLSPAAKNVATTFENINITSGSIWKNIKGVVKENIENIKENLGLNSRQGSEAIAANFNTAQIKIEESMKKGGMSVKIGMGRIRELVSEQLKIFGVHPSEIAGVGKGISGVGKSATEGLKGFAAGGYIPARPGGRIARVGEGKHDEVILSTDPRHVQRSKKLLGQYLRAAPHMTEGGRLTAAARNALPDSAFAGPNRTYPVFDANHARIAHMLSHGQYAAGGYIYPFHGGEVIGRTDMGVDVNLPVGGAITAIGDSLVKGVIQNWYKSQPYIWAELLSGPDKGKDWYVAEQINRLARVGSTIKAGQPIAYYAPTGTGIEMGWATSSGQTLAQATTGYREGQQTAAGSSFRSFISALQHGKVIAGGAGQAIQEIIAPKIKGGGAIGQVAQGALNLATKAANIYLSKRSKPHTGGTFWSEVGRLLAGKIVTASEFGGHNDPSAYMKSTASGKMANDTLWGFAELSNPPGSLNFSALGHLPMGTKIKVGYGGKHIIVPKVDVGAGGPGLGGHIRAIDLTYAAARALGTPGLENVTWEKMAMGGLVFSHLRRMGIRHLRRKVLKFAEGGIAPWGGRPVPIIAHEGERIMNPAQYHETARLAGTTPHGLDSHLGYDGKPRQSFAGGGIPRVLRHFNQPITPVPPATLASLYKEFEQYNPLLGEPDSKESIKKITKVFKLITEGFKKLKSISKDNEKYVSELAKFVSNIVIESSGILAKLKEGREFVAAKLEREKIKAGYINSGGKIVLGSKGQAGIAESEEKALAKEGNEIGKEVNIVNSSMSAVKSGLSSANKMPTKTSAQRNKKTATINKLTTDYAELMKKQKELGEEMNRNIEARYQAESQVLQDQITEVNNQYQVISQEQQAKISKAQALGNLGEIGALEEQTSTTAKSQIEKLRPILAQAQAIGNRELESSIKQEIIGLEQTINSAIVEKISSAQNLIQRESAKAEAKSGERLGISKVLSAEGRYEAAGREEKAGLAEKQANLLATKAQDEALKKQALREGDISAAITLGEDLNKNSTEIEENNLALKENAVITRELIVSQIEATGQFKSGIYAAAQQGLEILGQTTGFHNVAGLIAAAKGKAGVYAEERTGLEREAGGIGLGVEGMTPAEILTYLASPAGQMKLSELEKHEDKGEREQMYKLVSALETNANNTLKNAEELAKLNGQLNQPQTWSTTAFKDFRAAFFTGMGGLLPEYSAALPPVARPTELPVYGEQAPSAAKASPTIGTLNLTHPVEKLDLALLGEELSYHISTTPAS